MLAAVIHLNSGDGGGLLRLYACQAGERRPGFAVDNY